jgi:hypothetical protein
MGNVLSCRREFGHGPGVVGQVVEILDEHVRQRNHLVANRAKGSPVFI